MFVIKRNQVIITALVIMIAVAGYLNYIDSNGMKQNQMILNDEGEITALIPFTDSNSNRNILSRGEIGTALTIDDNPAIAVDVINTNQAINSESVAETIIPNSEQLSVPTKSGTSEPGEAIFVNTSLDSSYFVQAKLEREQARAKQKEYLIELINNNNIVQEKRAECADAMLEIQKRIEKETAAEAMIEAKGFKEVYVRIDDNTVDVVVNKDALSDAEIAQIEDIVKRKTGMNAEQIRISPMKK